jgi:type VI protein secretion system component VasK
MTTFTRSLAVHVVNSTPDALVEERRLQRRRKVRDNILTVAFIVAAAWVWLIYLTEPK